MFKYLSKLFNEPSLRSEFGAVEVTLISDRDALAEILSIPHLKELRILVHRPNPDGFGSFDSDVEARLAAMEAQSLEVTYRASHNGSLSPDDATKSLAEVATRNGRVDKKGQNADGLPVNSSTDDHPLLVSRSFRTDGLSEVHFLSVAKEFIQRIKDSIRQSNDARS